MASKWGRRGLWLGGAVVALAAAGAGAWWWLQPREREVTQLRDVAPPEKLAAHCRDHVGEPRVLKVGERVLVAVGYDLANTILIRTATGNVVIDPGMSPKRASETKRALLEQAPGKTLAVIYTHSHIDHVGGASVWLDEGTEIWATEAFAEHFVKQYAEFRRAESRRGARQFGLHASDASLPCSALGRRIDLEAALDSGARMPTKTFSSRTTLELGGVRLELVEAHGETHDQLFAWLPEERILMPGDNYYRAFPNLYTIRGTAPRPVEAWIESLDAMRRLEPAQLVPSHTTPVAGRDEVLAALTRYRDGIQWVRDRVVQGANADLPIETIVAQVGLPPKLAADRALDPLYGQVDWSARAIYTNHLGWFDGRPETLYPMAERERAKRSVELMGGLERVFEEIDKTRSIEPRWALHLLALLKSAGLVALEPDGRWAKTTAETLERLAEGVGNSNGRGYLLESAFELRNAPSPAPTPQKPPAFLDAIPMSMFFRIMASRLIPERSLDVHEAVCFEFDDTKQRFTVTIRHGIAEAIEGEPLPGTPEPLARVKTTARAWRRIAVGATKPVDAVRDGELEVEGEVTAFYTFTKRFQRGM